MLTLLIGRGLFFNKPEEKPVDLSYRKLEVDNLPIVQSIEKKDFRQLLQKYEEENGKVLRPIKRRSKTRISLSLSSPVCGAPSEYLYANNGAGGQCECKVCGTLFSEKNRYAKELILKCPHCMKTLEKIKERKDFNVHKCKNDQCPYYLGRLNGMTKQERKKFKKDPQSFKMRYIYREFLIDFKPVSMKSPVKPKVNISRLQVSPHTLGLILTYHVNYGLSARKTAALMKVFLAF